MIKEQMKSLQGSKGGKNVKDLGTFNIGNLQEILMEGGENAFDFGREMK